MSWLNQSFASFVNWSFCLSRVSLNALFTSPTLFADLFRLRAIQFKIYLLWKLFFLLRKNLHTRSTLFEHPLCRILLMCCQRSKMFLFYCIKACHANNGKAPVKNFLNGVRSKFAVVWFAQKPILKIFMSCKILWCVTIMKWKIARMNYGKLVNWNIWDVIVKATFLENAKGFRLKPVFMTVIFWQPIALLLRFVARIE